MAEGMTGRRDACSGSGNPKASSAPWTGCAAFWDCVLYLWVLVHAGSATLAISDYLPDTLQRISAAAIVPVLAMRTVGQCLR